MLARDVADFGYPDFTIEDLHADWATPGLDLERDARVVEGPGGEIVASSLLLGDDALVYVHPDACGRGLGTALRELAEERARERGTAVLRQFIPTGNEAAAPLLLDAGYWPVQHYLRMRIALEDAPPHADARRCARSSATTTRSRSTSSSRRACRRSRATSPSRWRSGAASGSRSSAGTRRCGCCSTTTRGSRAPGSASAGTTGSATSPSSRVAPRARGRGYGRALLLALFEAFRADGLRRAELSVHGANRGAARLYESVGMRASWEAQRWEKALGKQ